MKPVIEPLYSRRISGGAIRPCLPPDGRIDLAKNSITLTLRKGVKFHDGTDFNAQAVKWCIDQAIQAKQLKGFLTVDVIDDYTVRVNVDKYENDTSPAASSLAT